MHHSGHRLKASVTMWLRARDAC